MASDGGDGGITDDGTVIRTSVLKPPRWSGGDDHLLRVLFRAGTPPPIEMTPRSPPVRVPFGRPHAVRTIGKGRSLFCYAFGAEPVGGWPEPSSGVV